MPVSPSMIILAFTLLWFVVYWLVAGVIFAILGLARFMRINTARFSCLLTLLSLATAFAAAWTGYTGIARAHGRCLAEIDVSFEVIPGLFHCSKMIMFSNAFLWFIVLMTLGIGLMFISRLPDRPRAPTRVNR